MKSAIIIKEISRSFSKHIVINLLLIVQFIISFFLLITILTYHLDFGDNSVLSLMNYIDGKEWLAVRTDSQEDVNASAEASDGLSRIKQFYDEFSSNDMFEFISYKTHQCIYFDSTLMEDRFGEVSKYADFIDRGENNDIALVSCFNEMKDGETEFVGVSIKSVQMNLSAYQAIELQVTEGEGFTEENIQINSDEDYMPIILGYEYKNCFEVGETIRIQLPAPADDWYYNARVDSIYSRLIA